MTCTHVPLTDITFNLHVGFHRFKRRKKNVAFISKFTVKPWEKLNTQRAHM